MFVKVAEPVPWKLITPGAGVEITNIDAGSGDAGVAFAVAANREAVARALASMKERFIISPNRPKGK